MTVESRYTHSNFSVVKGDTWLSIEANNPEAISQLKEIIYRGTNLWNDAPAEVKELSDLVCEGRILQDYHSQDTSKEALEARRQRVQATLAMQNKD